MTWLERLRALVSREAADLRDGARTLGRKFDEELTRREQELAATPEQRVEMIEDQIVAEDERFAALEAEVAQRVGGTAGEVPEHRVERVQLLEPEDVSDSPRIQDAIAMVNVTARGGAPVDFEVAVAMPDGDESDPTADVARVLADHPLVERAEQNAHGVVEVTSPTLHGEDLRLIAAAVVAARLPSR